jgi:GNAT superfamily N-acetyltransferase
MASPSGMLSATGRLRFTMVECEIATLGMIESYISFVAVEGDAGSVEVKVRRAVLGDAKDIARLHTHCWRVAYRGILPDGYLDALDSRRRFEMWQSIIGDSRLDDSPIFVAVDADNVVWGFASMGPTRDDDLSGLEFFEMYAIYVHPDLWRQGVGAQLLAAALCDLPTTAPGLTLWVLAENVIGRRFYHSHGFVADGESRFEEFDDTTLSELRYRRVISPNQ